VVEFYNASLDHYFITGSPQEISDLDTGVHGGWTRTGQSFNAYGIGSTGDTGRRPVCRLYGVPAAGLDSHFYSASPDEWFTTAVRLSNAWEMEADEVFELDLPDAVSGVCPAGVIPVYRLWNGRMDSNHRYTTSPAIRDQMLAKGYIAEGYGPETRVSTHFARSLPSSTTSALSRATSMPEPIATPMLASSRGVLAPSSDKISWVPLRWMPWGRAGCARFAQCLVCRIHP
jgi:hypothetical protein